VPASVSHYLIRRGGATLVDRLAAAGADLRRACFLVGEKLVALRRAGVAVDAVPFERWLELSRAAAEEPVLWEAWERIVRAMAAAPGRAVAEIVAVEGLGVAPAGWREEVARALTSARSAAVRNRPERVTRLALGLAMRELRGKVPATKVAAALAAAGGER
jgi:Glu-tRNA(Gln) amidotransferase subunit E-like FAD-binding protein